MVELRATPPLRANFQKYRTTIEVTADLLVTIMKMLSKLDSDNTGQKNTG